MTLTAWLTVVRVGYDEPSIMLSEEQPSATLCVTATSPGIEAEFVINTTTVFYQTSKLVCHYANALTILRHFLLTQQMSL